MGRECVSTLLIALVVTMTPTWPVEARCEGEDKAPPVSLAELENQVAAAPSDQELRWRLLRASFPPGSPEARAARTANVLWVIRHTPDAEIAGSPYARVHRLTEPAAYKQASALWLSMVKQEPANLRVLLNAARFFASDEPKISEALFSKGMRLEPQNPEWRTRLGMLRMSQPSQTPTQAEAALSVLEPTLTDAANQEERYHALARVADAALAAGEDQKARAYAEELLLLSEALPQDWNYGNAIHDGNRILGHVALRAGDIEAAKTFLLKAGETQGSPQLNSFGPSLSLAKELLARRERDVVVRYLQLCSRFWEGHSEAIDKWVAEIRAGKTPDLNRFLALRSHS